MSNSVPNPGSGPLFEQEVYRRPEPMKDESPPVLSALSRAYWREALRCARQLRMLIVAALLVACRVAITSFTIPLGQTLRISFGFFFNATGSFLYGPVLAPITGMAADLIGYMMHPSGAYFPGYTLTAMAGSFFYALFLFRKRITVLRLALTKIFINVLVNVGMNSLWSAMLYGKGFYYYVTTRIAKNLLMLPVEIVILVLFFRVMLPVIGRMGFAPVQEGAKVPLW